jgi:NADH-quinone oxidoreductase subunit C
VSISNTCPLPKDLAACRKPGDFEHTGNFWNIHVLAEKLPEAVRSISDQGFYLEDVMGLDTKEGFEVVYHFDHFTDPGRITLRVLVSHEEPEIPSIAGIYQGAEWHERETQDFYGVVFTDNPNPAALLLPDDMELRPLVKEEKARMSVYELFPNYDVVDCRPEFLKEDDRAEPEADAAQAEESGA